MVYPEFQPSNADTKAIQNAALVDDHWDNVFARAQALRQSREQFEMGKDQFAANLATTNLGIQQQQLQLKKAQYGLQNAEKDANLQGSMLDYQQTLADNARKARDANAQLLAKVPDRVNEILSLAKSTNPQDQAAYLAKLRSFQAETAPLATDPNFSSQFQTLQAPVLADAQSHGAAFATLSKDAGARIRSRIISAQSPEELSAVTQDGWFPYASDANFGGDPKLIDALQEKQKQVQEFQVKKMEAEIARGKQGRELKFNEANNLANSQTSQNYEKATAAFNDATASLNSKNPTTYSDQAALTAFFKIIDPTMGFNASQDEIFTHLGSTAGRLAVNARNVITDGGKFTPQMRQDLLAAVNESYKPVQSVYRARAKRTMELMRSEGIDPSGVLSDDAMKLMDQPDTVSTSSVQQSSAPQPVLVKGKPATNSKGETLVKDPSSPTGYSWIRL